ncbi:hypothetical protein B0H17DRAFT_1150088 [Mycena rosella]|uniref:Uncharacterized protein n=1 Tax=Mycena rosella TaxID=1033263 RepID=A0AAD7BWP2_MYCRO|nr:hypothetical protein B0H17DRAFT_1150088 [Mycena rosella]
MVVQPKLQRWSKGIQGSRVQEGSGRGKDGKSREQKPDAVLRNHKARDTDWIFARILRELLRQPSPVPGSRHGVSAKSASDLCPDLVECSEQTQPLGPNFLKAQDDQAATPSHGSHMWNVRREGRDFLPPRGIAAMERRLEINEGRRAPGNRIGFVFEKEVCDGKDYFHDLPSCAMRKDCTEEVDQARVHPVPVPGVHVREGNGKKSARGSPEPSFQRMKLFWEIFIVDENENENDCPPECGSGERDFSPFTTNLPQNEGDKRPVSGRGSG